MTGQSDTKKNRRGGTPGNKGGTGRPSDALRVRCQTLLKSAKVWSEAKRVSEDGDHEKWLETVKFLADRAYGKVAESVELSGKDGEPLRVIYADE